MISTVLFLLIGIGGISGTETTSVSLEDAVKTLNSERTESVGWFSQLDPVTKQEVLASLVHEAKHLSPAAQRVAGQIIATGRLPEGVRLIQFKETGADRHKTYVDFVRLTFDSGAVLDENGRGVEGQRLVETLHVRKRYLATQPLTHGKIKSLDELLTVDSE